MTTLWGFLVAALGPLVNRVLAMLFLGIVSFTGVDAVFGQLQGYAQSAFGSLPVALLQLAGLAGVPTALGLLFGAINVRLAIWTAASVNRWVVKGA